MLRSGTDGIRGNDTFYTTPYFIAENYDFY